MLFQFELVMIIRMSVRYESFLHLKLPCALVPSRQPPTKSAVVFSNLTDLISRPAVGFRPDGCRQHFWAIRTSGAKAPASEPI
jgi:hypothetical protein